MKDYSTLRENGSENVSVNKWLAHYNIHFYECIYLIQSSCGGACCLAQTQAFICFSNDKLGSGPYRAIIHHIQLARLGDISGGTRDPEK